jgi:hypothetical protein
MECAQLVVSGGKSVVTPATYSIPGIYKVTCNYLEVQLP